MTHVKVQQTPSFPKLLTYLATLRHHAENNWNLHFSKCFTRQTKQWRKIPWNNKVNFIHWYIKYKKTPKHCNPNYTEHQWHTFFSTQNHDWSKPTCTYVLGSSWNQKSKQSFQSKCPFESTNLPKTTAVVPQCSWIRTRPSSLVNINSFPPTTS